MRRERVRYRLLREGLKCESSMRRDRQFLEGRFRFVVGTYHDPTLSGESERVWCDVCATTPLLNKIGLASRPVGRSHLASYHIERREREMCGVALESVREWCAVCSVEARSVSELSQEPYVASFRYRKIIKCEP